MITRNRTYPERVRAAKVLMPMLKSGLTWWSATRGQRAAALRAVDTIDGLDKRDGPE